MSREPPSRSAKRDRSRLRAPSIASVATRAGVSIATVSRVINGETGLVRKSTADRVLNAIEELRYRPQPAGRALRTRQTRSVAVLVPDTLNIMGAVATSIEMALREDGKVMFLCNTHGNPDLQDAYLDEMRAHMVGAIVVVGAVESPVLSAHLADGDPIIFAIRKSPVGAAPFVGIDSYAAGRDVANHMLAAGYDPCATIHGQLISSASREMLHGFRDRLVEGGGRLDERHVLECPSWSIEQGYHVFSRLMEVRPRPRAVFCFGDNIAYGAHRRCVELGLRVPEDLALFGFEDNPLNEWLAPWLSTVRVPYMRFGPAIREIMNRLPASDAEADTPHIILPHTLVVRGSA